MKRFRLQFKSEKGYNPAVAHCQFSCRSEVVLGRRSEVQVHTVPVQMEL